MATISDRSGGSASQPSVAALGDLHALIHDLDAIVWEADARTWRFTFVSQQAVKILGYPLERWLTDGQFWVNLIHPQDREQAVRHCMDCTARCEQHALEYRAIAADGRIVWLHDAVHVVPDSAGQPAKLRGVMVDITARKWSEFAMEAHQRTLELIARGENLEPMLFSLAQIIEQQSVDGAIASIMLLDGDRLRHGAAPSLPTSYCGAIEGLQIGPQAGSCGTAVYRREQVIAPDIAVSPLWDNYRELALAHGLRACWSTPITSASGELLGSFAIYYRVARQPSLTDLEMVKMMTRAAAIAIERHKARQALREADLQVVSILNRITDGFVAFDRQWRMTYLNDRAAELILRRGLTVEQVLGKVVWEVFPDLNGSELHREYEVAMRQQKPAVLDFYYPTLDIWLEHRAYPSEDGLTVYFQDVTERRQHQQVLRESEERYRVTFEQAAVGVAHVSLQGKWLRVNQRLCDIVGYTREELLGMNFVDITHPEDLGTDVELRQRAGSGNLDCFTREKRYIRKDGSVVWTTLSVSLVRTAKGQPSHFISVTQDISRRKDAEHQLEDRARQQRQLYQLTDAMNRAGGLEAIFEAALDVIVNGLAAPRASILLADQDRVVRFKAWRGLSSEYRAAVEGHFPWSLDDRNPQTICIEDIRQVELEPTLRQTIESEGIGSLAFIPLVYQERLLGKFMVYYSGPHAFTRHELELAQTIGAQLAFAIERRRTDEALREAKEQAEAANRAKDRFLAVLSHELRTPLTPVVMTVTAMEQSKDLPEHLREELSMVRRNIDLEAKLIDDLLDLSRVASGKLRLHMEPLRIHEVLQHVVGSCASEAQRRQLTVECTYSAAEDCVHGDSARLQQVFWNLLKNAIKFTPQGGRVAIRTASGDGRLRVEIADTGVGISPDVLPRLFNAFEQGNGRVTRQFGGLGLGLAIAKMVVDLHGGSIRASSAGEGEGSTFVVELLLIAAGETAARHRADTSARRSSSARCRVLLVEDHPDSARTLAKLLSHSGYAVQTAGTVAAALQIAAREAFDLVVSDIGLPDATGYELMAQLRHRHNLRGIALSGYGMEEDIRRSREAGFSEHVVKPINLPQLESAIQRVLAHET
jgi:PAS domain S-box-containing protein